MPQDSNIIATKTSRGDVLVFDYQKHPTSPETNECKPNLRLKGLSNDGYGLDWNRQTKGTKIPIQFSLRILIVNFINEFHTFNCFLQRILLI